MTIRVLFFSLVLLSGPATAPGSNPPPSNQTTQDQTTPDQTAPAPATPSPGAASLSPRARTRAELPSLWEDSIRYIKQGGWDLGGWIAERRQALVDNSIRNPYFWYSVVSLLIIAFLSITVYFQMVSEDRKIWIASGCMTDLLNWANYCDWEARRTIKKYNELVDDYNRLAELEEDGKLPSPSQSTSELDRMQNEIESLRRDKARLEQEVAEKHETIQGLTVRVHEIAKQVGASPADMKVQAQLMEKVNVLSSTNQQLEQQLADARQKLARFTGEKGTTC